MSGLTELVGAEIAAHLESLGYRAEQAEVKEILPVAARGNNAVVVAPPSAAHALPALAGVCRALADGEGLRGLVLVPTGALGAWTAVLAPLARAAGLRLHAGEGQARAARHLSAGAVDLLLTTPDTALALQQRAALKADALKAVVLAWPELWAEAGSLTPLMADAKECQRVLLTSDATQVAELVERYARKAMTFGVPGHDATGILPLGPVRTVAVAEPDRARALVATLEVLDPASATVWALDQAGAAEAEAALAGRSDAVTVVTGDAPAAKVVLAWDLPTRARLEQLLAAGEVVLFLPPQAERWAATALRDRKPLRLPSGVDGARDEAARRRTQVTDLLEAGLPSEGLLALAPLFERYDATLVAAALYQLGKASGAVTASAPLAPPAPVVTGTMWVSAGSMDGIQPKDIVGALVNETKVDRASIGKVDVREKFTLVELPAADLARIATAFTGTTIKRKRVLARPDRARDERPAGRGGERPSRGPRTERPPRRTRD
ncbi:MAG TPA: DbpA RNA binding domain-containing protein [Gemmatimonadales bacterium]|nr:DbpA RNA binding domain-containing protein [Gemmatimonadales bacterium]